MASYEWSTQTNLRLLGCGIDSEKFARFAGSAFEEPHPMPLVFSRREVAHARTLPDPAMGLCACFCSKEAMFKALGEPYDFTRCELFPDRWGQRAELRLGEELCRQYGIAESSASVRSELEEEGETVVVVYIFGDGR